MELRVDRVQPVVQSLNEVGFPQWAVTIEQAAVQSGRQLQEVTYASRLGQGGATKVIVKLDLPVERPRDIGEASEECRTLTEGRLYLGAFEHGLVGIADILRPGVFGRLEELERSHVHRVL